MPENKIQISALRLEEDGDHNDRRNNKMIKLMAAPALNQQKMKEELLIDALKN